MKLHEFVDAFTANLGHEISDLGGSAATAKATINTLLFDFQNDFSRKLDCLREAIGEVLDRHAEKANKLAEAARSGSIVMPSVSEAPQVDVTDDDREATIAMARKLAARKAA
jgi:hypothetical protein